MFPFALLGGRITGVRLTFGEDDEEQFFETRDELLDEIEQTLGEEGRPTDDSADIVGSISVFLDWRWNYSSGQLDRWSVGDVDEFLIDWLPRKYSAPPEAGAEMCSAVADFFVHMGARERLVGGLDRAAALVARAYELSDTVVDAMGDPSNFGMAKSMFAADLSDGDGNPLADIGALLESGVDSDDPAFKALMQERMDAFNALPFDERKQITDRSMAPLVPPTRRIRIPVVDMPPTIDDVERSAADSRLLRMVDELVDYVGTKGVGVTQAGNLRLADAEQLVKLLGTDDVWARTLPWSGEPAPVRTSTDLAQLTLVFDVAEGAGAFVRLKTKVKVDPEWLEMSVPQRAQQLVDSLLDLGPVSAGARWEIFFQVASLVEDGIPHWLSMALPEGAEIETEPFVDQAIELVDSYLPTRPALWSRPGSFEEIVARQVFEVFEVLDFAGLVDWQDRVEVIGAYDFRWVRGGWFRLTPLGRHTMVDHIRDAGYDFPTLTDLSNADAEDLVNVSLTTSAEPGDLLRRWRPDVSTADRAVALTEFAMSAEVPDQRITAMKMLGRLDPISEVEPAVRQMLDSTCAGHATMFLLERGLASPDELGAFLDIAPIVDLLATVLDAPDVLSELFTETYAKLDDDLMEELWRHEQPETIEILEVLGKHLPDKKLAKAARKAAIKHRSWMANRQR